MLHRLISFLLVIASAPLALAQERVKDPTKEEIKAADEKKERDAKVKAMLERELPAINFSGVSLSDAFDFIRDVSGANIHVNWKALEKAGVKQDTQVSMKLRQISVATVLNVLVNEATSNVKLGWAVDDGVVEVTTAELLGRDVRIKVYEVRDLLDPRAVDQKGEILSTMIVMSIAPDSWRDKGGNGSIKYSDGKLVITQTPANHEAIKNLLNGLREFRR